MYDVSYVSNLTKRKNKELNWIELNWIESYPLEKDWVDPRDNVHTVKMIKVSLSLLGIDPRFLRPFPSPLRPSDWAIPAHACTNKV
jgi:hypothetical protein